MRGAAAIASLLLGLLLMLVAPDPFGVPFDLGLFGVVGGVLGLPLIGALRLRRGRARWRRWGGGAGLGLVLAAGAVLAVTVVDYRMLVFRRTNTESWRADLRMLQQELDRLPRGLRDRARDESLPALRALEAALPQLSEDQRHAAVVRAIAALSDGHSIDFPFFPATDFTLVPLQIRDFADGWFVIAAPRQHAGLVGARIVRLGGLPVVEAFTAIRPYISADNESAARVRAPAYMLSPRFLKAIGLAVSDEALDLEVEVTGGARRQIRIAPTGRLRYLWWYLEPRRLWAARRPWSMTPMPERGALSIAMRSIRHDGSRTLTMFAQEALAEARRIAAARLVIDVRGNSGGDNTTFRGFVDAIAGSEFHRRGRLFLLIDGGTFSAATNFVSAMERRTAVVLVGTPTGSGPNHYGDSRNVILPRTRIFLLLSSRYHQFGEPSDTRTAHTPHVRVEVSAGDYFAGHDPVLEAALAWKPEPR